VTTGLFSVIPVVAVKELKDFFRDPRSLALSFGLPLILFPLLFWVLSHNQAEPVPISTVYQIGVDPSLSADQKSLESETLSLSAFRESYPFNWRNQYDALLLWNTREERKIIIYDNSNPLSISAYQHLEKILSGKRAQLSTPAPVDIPAQSEDGQALFSREEAGGKSLLGLLLPFLFFVFAITCPLPGAADLSSGEKERGSLEPLLSTAAPRTGLILGKLSAASLIGLCSVCAYSTGVALSCLISPEILGPQPLIFPLSWQQICVFSFILILLTCLFTAIEICAGFITKSVREAQLLVMPLLVLGMGAVYTAQSLEIAHKSWIYSHLPLVNLALVLRETALDRMIGTDIVYAILWNLFYLILFIFMAVGMFQKEMALVKTNK